MSQHCTVPLNLWVMEQEGSAELCRVFWGTQGLQHLMQVMMG